MSNIKKKETQELNTEVSTFDMSSFMEDGLQKEDLKIETITLVQANSTVLQENTQLKPRQFYTSISRDLLTDREEWEFIALYTEPVVQVFKNKTGKEEWELAKKGDYIETVKRKDWNKAPLITKEYIAYEIQSVFVSLIGEDMITEIPYKLNFKSSNKPAFQPIIKTLMKFSSEPGFNQTHVVFKMGTKVIKGDESSWFGYDVSFSRKSTEEERASVARAMEILNSLSAETKLDDASEEGHKEPLRNYAPEM